MLSERLATPSERVARYADAIFGADARRDAFDRFLHTASGHERPGRYWRVDLDAVAPDEAVLDPQSGSVEIACDDARVRIGETPRVLGMSKAGLSKFGALAQAFANRYAFVTVPAEIDVAQPIVITYRANAGEAVFPYTCVHVERGARATIVERYEAGDGAFVCGVSEIVTEESSDATLASFQRSPGARILTTRCALPGSNANLALAVADLGGALVTCDIDIALLAAGAEAHVASLFFPDGNEHVDVRSTVDHRVGGTISRTTVRSAAADRGQARYLGNIRIEADAQKSDASLRDDALLLSPGAHIDSVPALEIAANDVKAYHGATVGALDAEMLFYMTTRGIEREAAERMVTLGFFESAIELFPASLKDEIRAAIDAKVR